MGFSPPALFDSPMNPQPSPRLISSVAEMQRLVMDLRRQGRRVGLVPTMGALHEGHLSLVREARLRADVIVTTIFVNPTQFGPSEDFTKYPRTLDADLAALATVGCEFVFVPQREEMYPAGYSTYVEPPAVAAPLEGVFRPGHFRGVASIVLKLFQICPADVACFGQKDYQQARVIQQMVRDLNVPMEIVVCPIVREPDGLALSSRNRYLSAGERQRALALSRSLQQAQRLVERGVRSAEQVCVAMQELLEQAPVDRLDYAAIVDPETLQPLETLDRPAVALIAAVIGTTRLIDNGLIHCAGQDLRRMNTALATSP
jgi:pantoate--beta-alanine ligase